MLAELLDFFFPKSCLFCDTQGKFICERCKKTRIVFYKEHNCHVCKKLCEESFVHEQCKSQTNLAGVFIAAHYNNAVKLVIEELKYNFCFSIAVEIGVMMKALLEKESLAYEALIPVPLHKFKRNYRGFNQAELIARAIGQSVDDCLVRTKNTKTQVNLNREERIANLKEVFRVKGKINYKSVVLVDDIMTTGTTLEECALVLKLQGVEKVYGLVFARD